MRGRGGASRRLRFRIVASVGVLVVVLGVLEVAARAVGPVVPTWAGRDSVGVIMIGHATRLWGMAPGDGNNAGVTAHVNTLGLRGPIPRTPRPAGHARILVLGDSTFFGHGVPDDATIGAAFEIALLARGVDVDVANGGIPGYSTEQTRLLLDEVGWSLEPTLLLIGNLWSDNNADGFSDADLLRTTRAFRGNPLADSALFRLTAGWADRLRGGDGGHIITWTRDSTWPTARERRVPLRRYAENLDAMVRDARARGIGAAFIAPANRGLVEGSIQRGAGWDPYFRTQRAVADWHGLPIVSALDALRADPAPVAEKFVDALHPSALGDALIGRDVARTLVEAGWPGATLHGRAEPFDTSSVVDDPSQQPGIQAASTSPQAQLFPGVVDDAAGGAPPVPTQATNVADPPRPPTLSQARVANTSWEVRGRVSAGTVVPGQAPLGPIHVAVRSHDGRPLAFTQILEPGPFTLRVREDNVQVVATFSDGRSSTAAARQGGEEVVLVLP